MAFKENEIAAKTPLLQELESSATICRSGVFAAIATPQTGYVPTSVSGMAEPA